MRRLPWFLGFVGGCLMTPINAQSETLPLRDLAEEQGVWIGAAVNRRALPEEEFYR